MTEIPPIEDLIPHSGEVVLLDRVIEVTEETLAASTTVRNDGLFNATEHTVPAYIAVEYMAQAVAAWAGYFGQLRGEGIQPGLLLGVRDFTAEFPYLAVGTQLKIDINRIMEMPSGLGVFDGKVTSQEISISARLSVLTVNSLEELPQ